MPNNGDLRVYHFPQIGMTPFHQKVSSPTEAAYVLAALADEDGLRWQREGGNSWEPIFPLLFDVEKIDKELLKKVNSVRPRYRLYCRENRIRGDYSNPQGLEVYDEADIGVNEWSDGWCEWNDEWGAEIRDWSRETVEKKLDATIARILGEGNLPSTTIVTGAPIGIGSLMAPIDI